MKRNSETLRSSLFEQLEGLVTGKVKPDQAKAAASVAMAICKTVDLDIRASELFKDKDSQVKSLVLTGGDVVETTPEIVIDDDVRDRILKGYANGLPVETIAKRNGISAIDVELVIEGDNND